MLKPKPALALSRGNRRLRLSQKPILTYILGIR